MRNDGDKPRIIDSTVEKYLKSFGAVCIQGPKWCGKTWTSAFHAEGNEGDPDHAALDRGSGGLRVGLCAYPDTLYG